MITQDLIAGAKAYLTRTAPIQPEPPRERIHRIPATIAMSPEDLQRAIEAGWVHVQSKEKVIADMRAYKREWDRGNRARLIAQGLTSDGKPRRRPFYPRVTPSMTLEQKREHKRRVARECMRKLRRRKREWLQKAAEKAA